MTEGSGRPNGPVVGDGQPGGIDDPDPVQGPQAWSDAVEADPSRERRLLAVASAVAIVGYGLWWRGVEPLAEAPSYVHAGRTFTSGWHHIAERPPGYPLLLWITGSLDGPSTALLLVQLGLAVATAWILWSVARPAGLPVRWRLGVFAVALSPPVAQMAAYAETECLAAFLITAAVAAGVRARSSLAAALACGALTGAAVLVRPAFLLVAPILALALVAVRRRRSGSWSRSLTSGLALLAPWLLLVGGYVGLNGVRFGQPTLTPLLPWHLSTTTAGTIESLPASFEPLRSELIAERDRQLLVPGSGHDAEMYVSCQIWSPQCPRHAMAERLGLTDQELGAQMLRAQIWLIVNDPQTFVAHGSRSTGRFVVPFLGPRLDPRPGTAGSVVAASWWGASALAGAAAAAGLVSLVFAAWLRRLDGQRWIAGVGGVVVLVDWATSVFLETGDARLRTPVDPVIVLLAALGLAASLALRDELRSRQGPRSGSADVTVRGRGDGSVTM